MSAQVPVTWLSYCDDNPPRGRWDQEYLRRLLDGEEWLPPAALEFVDTPWDLDADNRGRVIVAPMGHYHENGEVDRVVEALTADLGKLEWAVLIATSDECATFPWERIDPWPDHVQLWVMLPRPERIYPPGTRFIGEGSPVSSREIAKLAAPNWEKDIDVFFSGQVTNSRREELWAAMSDLGERSAGLVVEGHRTAGFAQGMDRDEYLANLTRARIAPCPSGPCSQSSFRAYEALEAQCFPLLDALRPDSPVDTWEPADNYWRKVGLNSFGSVFDWRNGLMGVARQMLKDPTAFAFYAARASASYQQSKRQQAHALHDGLARTTVPMPLRWDANDLITAIVPTSPTRSNPSIDMIAETVNSIRERLPRCEILITCDGIREEQADMRADYREYLRRLCAWTNAQQNVCPFVYGGHLHQSGMLHKILTSANVTTPYLLYVEADCPLVGEIDFDGILETMQMDSLALMRLYHDVAITEGSEHLFLDVERGARAPHLPTVQWSQRPHVASHFWYQDLIHTYFGRESRTFIEDVMHGVVQHGLRPWKPGMTDEQAYAWRKRLQETWERWRMAVYAPEGSLKRSTHLDGRGDDPKYPVTIAYDSERPAGAPPEGEMTV